VLDVRHPDARGEGLAADQQPDGSAGDAVGLDLLGEDGG